MVNATPRYALPPERDPMTTVKEDGDQRTVWTGAESLEPTGIRSPEHPASSESLYRLRYPGHLTECTGPRIYLLRPSNFDIFL